ncbi:hypothetical protein CXG81DRAFT_7471, partial [Caulochytrium protostelioides]
VYNEVGRDIIQSSTDGINGTIFCYGQTGSGKTYTMSGTHEEPGVIVLSIKQLFETVGRRSDREFLLRMSYIEIYNEVIKDLLNPSNRNLKIHETPDRDIFVGNLTEKVVTCGRDVAELIMTGESNRHVGQTNMNEHSSRSHTIIRVVIESRERGAQRQGVGAVKVSRLNLVDLAGSERVSTAGTDGARLREGSHINKSLLTLGTVISKLSEGVGENTHIPYRDSKLTRILQPSLGGNAQTAVICTITLASFQIEETISTLKFAARARTICNKPEVNEVVSDETLLRRYRKEITHLKRQL